MKLRVEDWEDAGCKISGVIAKGSILGLGQ
jgi:hypothetical protein